MYLPVAYAFACHTVQMQSSTLLRESAQPRVLRAPKPRPGWGAVIGMTIFAMIAFPVIVLGGSALHVWSMARASDTTPTDAIVVLGAAQYNGKPSPVLRARLQHALSLYQSGVAPRIVTVGGKQSGDVYTEAGTGRQWLIDNGVAQDNVVAVQAGTDTLESLTNVAKLAAKNNWNSITIDTDPTHIARSEAMANRLGFAVHSNPTRSGDGSQLTDEYLVRETGAYLMFEIFGQWSVSTIVDQT